MIEAFWHLKLPLVTFKPSKIGYTYASILVIKRLLSIKKTVLSMGVDLNHHLWTRSSVFVFRLPKLFFLLLVWCLFKCCDIVGFFGFFYFVISFFFIYSFFLLFLFDKFFIPNCVICFSLFLCVDNCWLYQYVFYIFFPFSFVFSLILL